MDFVNERMLWGLRLVSTAAQITFFVKSGADVVFISTSMVFRNNMGQSGFTQTWRTIKQTMIESLTPFFGGANENLKIRFHFGLSWNSPKESGRKDFQNPCRLTWRQDLK